MSLEAAEYASRFFRENPGFADFFVHMRIHDEMFFHTIIMNSHLKVRVLNDGLHYMNRERPDPTHSKVHTEYPAILSEADYKAVMDSGKPYARKSDIDIHPVTPDIPNSRTWVASDTVRSRRRESRA